MKLYPKAELLAWIALGALLATQTTEWYYGFAIAGVLGILKWGCV